MTHTLYCWLLLQIYPSDLTLLLCIKTTLDWFLKIMWHWRLEKWCWKFSFDHRNELCFIIYIYAFSRRFYPKRLTITFRLYIFISMCVLWESNPQPFALLAQCSTTEPHRNTLISYTHIEYSYFTLWSNFCVFDQINAALMSRRVFFQKHSKSLWPQTFEHKNHIILRIQYISLNICVQCNAIFILIRQ